MRTEIIDYINSLALGGFILNQDLPFEESGTPLYLKNLKRIYVDIAAFENEPLIQALNGLSINNETTVIRVYFSCDAKQLPSNYETLISDLKTAKDITTIEGINRRQVVVSTEITADVLVTTLEYRFTKLST